MCPFGYSLMPSKKDWSFWCVLRDRCLNKTAKTIDLLRAPYLVWTYPNSLEVGGVGLLRFIRRRWEKASPYLMGMFFKRWGLEMRVLKWGDVALGPALHLATVVNNMLNCPNDWAQVASFQVLAIPIKALHSFRMMSCVCCVTWMN